MSTTSSSPQRPKAHAVEVGPEAPCPAAPAVVSRARGRRALRMLGSLVLWSMLAAAFAMLALLGIGPRLLGYRTETVLSGSMRPTFSPGDVVVITSEPTADVRVGQVISYRIPVGDHHVETHRVVRIVSGGPHPVVVTKGDANATPDPWQARLLDSRVWRERFVIPRLGYAINALRSPAPRMAMVIGAPALLALLTLGAIWRPRNSKPEDGERG